MANEISVKIENCKSNGISEGMGELRFNIYFTPKSLADFDYNSVAKLLYGGFFNITIEPMPKPSPYKVILPMTEEEQKAFNTIHERTDPDGEGAENVG
jgi:hypothetical protein